MESSGENELTILLLRLECSRSNKVNTKAADALTPRVTWSLAAIVLGVYDRWVFVILKEGFQLLSAAVSEWKDDRKYIFIFQNNSAPGANLYHKWLSS